MRGDEALSRNIKCAPFAWAPEVPQAEGACAGAIAEQAGSAGGSGGGGGASAAGAGAARQRLTSLRVRNVLDIDGTVNMMTPGERQKSLFLLVHSVRQVWKRVWCHQAPEAAWRLVANVRLPAVQH